MMTTLTMPPTCGMTHEIIARESQGRTYDFVTGAMPAGMVFSRGSSGALWQASILTKSAANLSRFDQHPAGSSRGLLMEQGATNYFRATNAANNAWWLKFGATVAAADKVAPDGTTSMCKSTEAATTGTHVAIYKSLTVTAGNYWVMSTYVAYAGRKNLRVKARSSSFTNRVWADFDVQAGTYVASGVAGTGVLNGYGIEATAIAGVYRVWVAGRTSATDTSVTFEFDFADNAWSESYTGDGASGMHFWGMNLTQGTLDDMLTSYIENTGTAADVTRASDVMSVTNLATMGFNPTQGTLVVEFMVGSTGALSNSHRIAEFYLDSNNRMMVTYNPTNTSSKIGINNYVGGVAVSAIVAGTAVTPLTVNRVAISYDAGIMSASVNGGAVTSAAITGLGTWTQMSLGRSASGAYGLNGWVRRAIYYPTSNLNLQQLSGV